ncbi:5-amino-6-(D-ribitylamino)uracil--L-tyrosine 4-hydroxyphenyl transferase CofH [Methanolobus profundi]|uniref:5-amino-6-(D-ribitylamino)uracil--L-tyrosine 4-hydroxyphenyl transferase n=1 Tax=Methanolobus profundi TaxID=487685 RepID=A0A1I4NID2_9EURY|nr:5-amino-6-(D-ribitylamino)uracil--L-tyrosine 4-hydroxyphenyl transferase CofH [Methanolobus profundi]SFM15110.1 FO synthase subunit 2 [Methanolobus profundi]
MFSVITDDILDNAYKGNISKEEAIILMEANPFELFSLADDLRSRAVGDDVTYVVNRNIYLTNMCSGTCGFCAFKTEKGYVLSIEDVLEEVGKAHDSGAIEVCVQGGYIPQLTMDYYAELFDSIRSDYPSMNIHALSPMEVFYAANRDNMTLDEAFTILVDSGVGTLTGTSAEILVDRVRKIICPTKLTAGEWADTIEASHNAGLRTNSTMMYGHVETIEERLDHIFTIRDIQQRTGGFTELIPMPFMPYNNKIGEEMIRSGKFMTTGIDDLQIHAISRIILHKHVDNIQAAWVKLGKKLAQVALSCGANDLGGTLIEDQITLASGGTNGEYTPANELKWMIQETGRTPKLRNALYEAV